MQKTAAEKVHSIRAPKKISGSRIGHIHGVDEDGRLLVDFQGNLAGPLHARFAASLKHKFDKAPLPTNDQVLIMFENADPLSPIVIDTLCDKIEPIEKKNDIELRTSATDHVSIDGKHIRFDAKEQIELRCGKSSITLTRAGKILIRGAYLLSRASGVNSIKGGSVQLN